MRGASCLLRDRGLTGGLFGLILCAAAVASAQSVEFTEILRAKRCEVLLPVAGRLYGGLADGGVVVWDPATPDSYQRWTSADGLTDNHVTDLAFSGSYLWVATANGGLTRVALNGGQPGFRKYASQLGGLQLTAVAGTVQGETELVFYGIAEGGVGIINNGLPGTVYTADEHGLIDNRVTALAFFQGDLWVGTEAGMSRFAGNLFSDQNTGLLHQRIRTLHAAGDTLLLAGTNRGVARWIPAEDRWEHIAGIDFWVGDLAIDAGGIWALRTSTGSQDHLWYWDGAAWTSVELPAPKTRAIATDGDLWIAGEIQAAGMSNQIGRAFLGRWDQTNWETWTTDESLPLAVDGLAIAPDGSLWLGSGNGQAVSQRRTDDWFHIYQLATAENDSSGLFAFGSNIMALAALPGGEVWFGQRTQGLLRFVPAGTQGETTDRYDHVTVANSALTSDRVTRIVQHPDGPLLFLTENNGVDVLLAPARWQDPMQWVHLPTDQSGLHGAFVRDAALERRDVFWFAVNEVGVVRWDINGTDGAQDALAWTNPGAQVWSSPLAQVVGSTIGLGETRGLAVTTSGSIWAGGSGGVVHFRYNLSTGADSLLAAYKEKDDVFVDGLLTSSVEDIELDANGDLWVAMDAGLNRIRTRDETTTIDAYTSLASYFNYGFANDTRYSSDIISGLPGGQVFELAAAPQDRRVLVGTAMGVAIIDIAPRGEGPTDPLAGLYMYPNPYPGDAAGAQLKLGGISAEVSISNNAYQGGAAVEIYNLEGQQIFINDHVASDSGFWEGRNLLGNEVASGLYVVKVVLQGRTAFRTLAVVQ